MPQTSRAEAAEIFAFDALIQNPDRRPENPNYLFDGRNLAIFDHELAFVTDGIIGWRPPWELGGLDLIKGSNRHVFFTDLQGKRHNFSRIMGAWQAVSDARLQEYRQALPPAWINGSDAANEILAYIAQVRENIKPALDEVARVLA